MKKIRLASILAFLAFMSVSCLPPVYIYERPTIMEEEASGDYPEFQKEMLKKSEAMGPAMFSPDEIEDSEENEPNKEKEKIYKVLDGEYLLVEKNSEKTKEQK